MVHRPAPSILTNSIDRRTYLKYATLGGVTALAGCTSNDEGDQTGTPTAEQSPSDQSGQTSSDEPVELVSSLESPLNSLDPHVASLRSDSIILKLICQQLFTVDSSGKVIPHLAENIEVSDDGMQWTISLREGVQFHSPVSREMVADDVVFTFDRIRDPEVGSWVSSYLDPVEEYSAVDDYTVDLQFSQPSASISALLGWRQMFIIPEEALDQVDISTHPVGTGPFVFEEWVSEDHITLSKHEEYWEEDLPHFDEVTLRPISESSVLTTELQTGNVEIAREVAGDAFGQLQNDPSITANEKVTSGWLQITANASPEEHEDRGEGAATSNVKVRQAIHEALDRNAIVDIVHGGFGKPAQTPYIEGNPWHVDYAPYDMGANPERARELCREAGFENPEVVFLMPQGIKSLEDLAEVAQANLTQAGFDVKPVQTDVGTAFSRKDTLGWDLITNYGPLFADPGMFRTFLHSEGSGNDSRLANDEVDRLFEELDSTFELEERQQVWADLTKVLVDEGSWLFVSNPSKLFAWRNYIKGFEISPTTTDYWIHKAYEG